MSKSTNSMPKDLNAPQNYFNRELSFIEFNRRVLNEAANPNLPLLERLKFCAILSSNFDEFFMIRVAGLKAQILDRSNKRSIDGKTARQQKSEIYKRLNPILEKQTEILIDEVLPGLKEKQIQIRRFIELNKESKEYLRKYFRTSILPALTPIALSAVNPFPRLINCSLNVAFVLEDDRKTKIRRFAFVQIPNILPRFIRLDMLPGNQYILIEQLIKEYADMLFCGMRIKHANSFRITRDADIEIAEDEAGDLIVAMTGELKNRQWDRDPVRLEHSSNMPKFLSDFLQNVLELKSDDVYVVNRPLNLSDFMILYDLDYPELKDKPFLPKQFAPFSLQNNDVFTAINNGEYLLHHPFDSFDSSVVTFIDEASKDKNVVAIKITLYRTNRNSSILKSLIRAANNGKSVVALVELKARFDEEKNIEWAKELETVGIHVVYGVPGLKTHSKIALVVRREGDKLRNYVHLATGNYNQITARLYTDIGFFTNDKEMGKDAVGLFNYLTGYSYKMHWRKITIAPDDLLAKTIEMIDREAELHTEENPGLLFAKMNSLTDEDIIMALYRASQKGVRIKLLIRGICCLKPGIPGISENIEVRSIIGKLLEHSRITYCRNGGEDNVYLSSADWMTRNMVRRVETRFPIENLKLKTWLIEILDLYWKDNSKSWVLQTEGYYIQRTPEDGEEEFSVQEHFSNY